jgi:hypothetical protein
LIDYFLSLNSRRVGEVESKQDSFKGKLFFPKKRGQRVIEAMEGMGGAWKRKAISILRGEGKVT